MPVRDYDQLVGKSTYVKLFGKEYEVSVPTLDAVLKFEELSNELRTPEVIKSVKASVETTIRAIKTIYSEIPDEDFRRLTIEQLGQMAKDVATLIYSSLLLSGPGSEKEGDKPGVPKKKVAKPKGKVSTPSAGTAHA
ncbi:MAG: hypothetical protein AB1401_00520 [Thermodesulfobacteriota bacterium]